MIHFQLSLLGVYSSGYNIGKNTLYSDEFRSMNFSTYGLNQITKFSKKNDLNLENCISVIMIVNNYDLSNFNVKDYSIEEYKSDYKKLKRIKEFKNIKNAYKKTLVGTKYFPLALKMEQNIISYEDSWGAERSSYGEKRSHEGTDIMDNQNKRGHIPVLSITDGIVENIGWLELGGYRIGIRSSLGGYFYYAHLYSYADGLKEGDSVHAGELIGFMGD